MAALNPANLNATTLEDALLELLRMVADRQTNTATNPDNRTVITQFTQNELTGVLTVGLTIPSTITNGASGLVVNATEVFT
jgi:hypothetical protein